MQPEPEGQTYQILAQHEEALKHRLYPVIDKGDPFLKNVEIETRGVVAGLVCIHGDPGSEHDCRNLVVDEYPLV